MPKYRAPVTDPTKLLTRREMAAVLADIHRKATRPASPQLCKMAVWVLKSASVRS
jgi:hypothetical protein